MTDPTYLGLLATILADPDDDAPRLIMADYLDERGECDRAEFIRIGCELSQLDNGAAAINGERFAALRRRERRYLDDADFLASLLPPDFGVGWGMRPSLVFSRGFLYGLACTAADFLAHADALLWQPSQGRPCPPTAQPVTKVTLTSWPNMVSWDRPEHKTTEFRLAGRQKTYDVSHYRQRGTPAPDMRREIVETLLKKEWPWVEFTLPRYGESLLRGAHVPRQMIRLDDYGNDFRDALTDPARVR